MARSGCGPRPRRPMWISTATPQTPRGRRRSLTEGPAVSHLSLRRHAHATVGLLAAGSLLSAGLTASASAAPRDPRPAAVERTAEHDLRSPMAVRQDALRSRALQKVLAGAATPDRTGPRGAAGEGPARLAGAAAHRPGLRPAGGVRRRAAPERPRPRARHQGDAGAALRRPAARPDPGARPHRRHQHPLAARATTARTTSGSTSTAWRPTTRRSPPAATRSRAR